MRAREILGRKITAIKQQRVWNEHMHQWDTHVYSMTLDDGSHIVFHAVETSDCPVVTADRVKP